MGLRAVDDSPNVTLEPLPRSYGGGQICLVPGENFLRVLSSAERTAAR